MTSEVQPKDVDPNEVHPVQTKSHGGRKPSAQARITLRAYEVYCHVYSPQGALIDLKGRGCRGGFSVGELIGFLYAHSFPKDEWKARTDEAFRGLVDL